MEFTSFDIHSALVLGLGLSGEAAARLLHAKGAGVTVIDGGSSERHKTLAGILENEGIRVLLGNAIPEESYDLCVVSPSIPLEHPWLKTCRERAIPVISELELGARYWRGKILAITGSKGKSSLVKLCSDTLNLAGKSASPAGNYGIPLCTLVLEKPDLQWAVVEVSSFQMEHTEAMSPDIAILLNLQADHLNRHGTMEVYGNLKRKLFRAMRGPALALAPLGFDLRGALPQEVSLQTFGGSDQAVWYFKNGKIRSLSFSEEVDLEGSWFNNPILGVAASAAVPALLKAGLTENQIRDGLRNFVPLAHRMQHVACRGDGLLFIDDSKATSLAALAAALKMVERPVRLIAGGLLKENDLDSVKEMLTQRVKKGYLIGDCADQMKSAWEEVIPCECCGTMEVAVGKAVEEASSGEIVLLSPGTASFDQFSCFEERGECFSASVRSILGVQ